MVDILENTSNMVTIGIYFVLSCYLVVSGKDFSNSSNIDMIEVCENAELNRPCELKCLSRCEGNCEVCLYHKGTFNDVSKICCSMDPPSVVGNTCIIERKRNALRNRTLHVFTLKKLHYDQKGEWLCGVGHEFSASKNLEPYYLNLHKAEVVPIRSSFMPRIPFLSEVYFINLIPSVLKIYIPCAYPRPTLTVAMQAAHYTCLLCQFEEPTQFLERCEVRGHIGSYNFTCNIFRKSLSKSIQCLYTEHLIVVYLNQRGRTTGHIEFNISRGVKAKASGTMSNKALQRQLGKSQQNIGHSTLMTISRFRFGSYRFLMFTDYTSTILLIILIIVSQIVVEVIKGEPSARTKPPTKQVISNTSEERETVAGEPSVETTTHEKQVIASTSAKRETVPVTSKVKDVKKRLDGTFRKRRTSKRNLLQSRTNDTDDSSDANSADESTQRNIGHHYLMENFNERHFYYPTSPTINPQITYSPPYHYPALK